VWQELQTVSTSALGLFTAQLGSNVSLSSVNWAGGAKFMQVEVDLGNGFLDIGTQQMLSVPYALFAGTAASVSGSSNTGNFTHYIGEEFGGGVVFYLWKDAQGQEHGLIVDKVDLSSQVWSNITAVEIGPSAQSIWDGLSNSNAIVSQAGHTNSAAALCLNSTNGGKTDWYLPSYQELRMLWNNYYAVLRTLSQTPGAAPLLNGVYWSSSELSENDASYLDFYNGGANSVYDKFLANYVRAVRAF
jgi:hypothetical protein